MAREFVIDVRRRWTLWILPTLALLYFAAVLYLVATNTTVKGVSTDVLALAGAALFLIVIIVEIPFFLTRRVKPAEPEAHAAAADWQDEPAEPQTAAAGPVDDEALQTDETQQGMRVLEYSSPAKSRNRGSVYAKTYVPVTKEHVLRVETLAAEPREL